MSERASNTSQRESRRESGGATGSKRFRALVAFAAIVGIALPFGPGLVSGCGSSSAAPSPAATTTSTATTSADATIPLVTVITAGGGAASSGAMIVNPFGGSSSSGSSSGGSSSGASSSSGSGDDSGADDGAVSEAGDAEAEASTSTCVNYVAPVCGTSTCDLRSNTCCVTFSLQARCIPGANAKCDSDEATVHCTQGCECTGGDVCCGVENTILGVVQTECQSLPSGGFCSPHPQTSTQASAQLCKETSECKNGEACIEQTCVYGAMLSVCGLQSQDPFDCTATPTQ